MTGDTSYHGFTYSGGTMTDLGLPPNGSTDSSAIAINNSGFVVGGYNNGLSGVATYSGGAWTDLGNGNVNTSIHATNSSGTVVGRFNNIAAINNVSGWSN